MRRFFGFVTAAVLLGLVGADAVYWRLAVDRLRDGLDQWIAAQRAQGWAVTAGAPVASGWPGAAVLTVPDLAIRHDGKSMPGAVSLALPSTSLTVHLLRPTVLEIGLRGTQRIALAGAQPVTVSGQSLMFAVPLTGDDSMAIDFAGEAVTLDQADGKWHATAASLAAHAEKDAGGDQPVDFSVNAEAIALPAAIRWPLGAAIANLSVTGTLNGPMPAERDIVKWADAWRDGGGSLEVKRLTLDWGPLNLSSSATLALDEERQPMGTGSAKVSGYADTLDRLAAASVLTKSAATVAKAVLSLLAGSTEDDTPSTVDVPLTLQYRTLSMRQVPLVRLPELDWPAN